MADDFNKVPSPSEEGVEIESWELGKGFLKRTITCQIRGHKGVPLNARMFAKLIIAQVKLLEAIEKEMSGKIETTWTMSEAAIIAEDGAFTITGVSREACKQALAKAKKEKKRHGDTG